MRRSAPTRGSSPVLDPIRDHFNRQPLSIADSLFARSAIRHDSRQLQRFGNPTPVVLAIDLNPDLHVYFSGQYPGLALTTASGNFVT